MSTIAENLLALQQAKADIKTAIEGKGQDLTDVPFTEYFSKIDEIQTSTDINPLQYKCDNMKSLAYEFYQVNVPDNMSDEVITKIMSGIDTSKVKHMSYMFASAGNDYGMTDLSGITIDASSCTNMGYMFSNRSSLTKIPNINNAKPTSIENLFRSCKALESPLQMDTSDLGTFDFVYYGCQNLKSTYNYDTSNAISFQSMYYSCYVLESEIEMTITRNGASMNQTFYYCHKVPKITIHGSENVSNFSSTFNSCKALTDLSLNLINATNVSRIVNNTTNMTNLDLKNIKLSLQIGSGNQYGHLLTLDSLLNTIKELWNMTDSSTLTLTIGSVNLEKIANIYVKLVDITDEMRAEDEYIDNKLPFEVCESTDDGAMTIQEYVTSKNWQLA